MADCRICDAPLESFLEFGPMPLADRFLDPDETAAEYFYDLAVGICQSCSMVQLLEAPDPGLIFGADYPYRTSGSAGMRAHFATTAQRLRAAELRSSDPFLVEIGSNDGAMLRVMAEAGVRHLGVEPAAAAAAVSAERGVRAVTEYFTPELARRIRETDGPADVIYAANTLCHIAAIGGALEGVQILLAPGGVLIFEDPYLGDIVATNAFDQIYDEHVFYFSLASVTALATRHGFVVVDVERLAVHGGELRYTLARRGERPVAPSVGRIAAAERAACLHEANPLHDFAERVHRIQAELRRVLEEQRAAGRRVVGYGATAKSATVTNSCGITPDLIEFVCDSTPEKQGKLTPGAHLPVRPPAAFGEPYPDAALLFAWNHAPEVMAKEAAFAAAGGQWILYVPELRLVGG